MYKNTWLESLSNCFTSFVELILKLNIETAGQKYLASGLSHQYVISAFFDFPKKYILFPSTDVQDAIL